MAIFFAALIPPLYLIRYIYKLDKIESEPRGLLVKLFILGALSILPAMLLEIIFSAVTEGMTVSGSEIWYLLAENFIGVALMEEFVKYLALRLGSWKHPAFDYRFDGIVYAVTTSLGFAALENILYAFYHGLGTTLFRAVTSIPGHAIFGIYMGYYYGMAKYLKIHGEEEKYRRYKRLCLIVPILLHGFYDFILSTQSGWMLLLFLVYIIVLDVIAVRSVKRFAAEDAPVDPAAEDGMSDLTEGFGAAGTDQDVVVQPEENSFSALFSYGTVSNSKGAGSSMPKYTYTYDSGKPDFTGRSMQEDRKEETSGQEEISAQKETPDQREVPGQEETPDQEEISGQAETPDQEEIPGQAETFRETVQTNNADTAPADEEGEKLE